MNGPYTPLERVSSNEGELMVNLPSDFNSKIIKSANPTLTPAWKKQAGQNRHIEDSVFNEISISGQKNVDQDVMESPWQDQNFNPFKKLIFPLDLPQEDIFIDVAAEMLRVSEDKFFQCGSVNDRSE